MFKYSKVFIIVLLFCCVNILFFGLQNNGLWWTDYAVQPLNLNNWKGFLLSPFLHGSLQHLQNNLFAFLILGTLSFSIYPKASMYSLPIIWFLSFIVTWGFGEIGTYHIGFSGITYGLMALLVTMGFLLKTRQSIAAMFIVLLFFGGAIWGFFPIDGVSATGHFGGALGGVLGALLFRKIDFKINKNEKIILSQEYGYEDENYPWFDEFEKRRIRALNHKYLQKQILKQIEYNKKFEEKLFKNIK